MSEVYETMVDESSRKPKKPSFIKRWLANIVKDSIAYEQNIKSEEHMLERARPVPQLSKAGMAYSLNSEPLRLNVYRANGGTIVETNSYDRKTDRNSSQLHIITHDVDLGQGISKIITMESLRG
jgi:hypothetical protein